jgi:hypothetical protein
MGDTIKNIGAGAVVINRSIVESAFNSVGTTYGQAEVAALRQIVGIVEKSGSVGATSCLREFLEQLSKPKRENSVLISLWRDIVILVPALAQLPAAISFISTVVGP